jgi:hypothetical protein
MIPSLRSSLSFSCRVLLRALMGLTLLLSAAPASHARQKFPFSITRIDAFFSDYVWTTAPWYGPITRRHPAPARPLMTRMIAEGLHYELWIEVLAGETAFLQDTIFAVHGRLPKGVPFVALVHIDELEESGTDLYTCVIDVETKFAGWADFILVPADEPYRLNAYEHPVRSNTYSVELKDPAGRDD